MVDSPVIPSPPSLNSGEDEISDGQCDLTLQERANFLFKDKEILAPMVRASSTPLRTLALSYGAGLVFTEEIVDRAITSTERKFNSKLNTIDYVKKIDSFSPKVRRRMASKGEELPVVLRIVPSLEKGKLIYQMGTGEASLALSAATMVCKDVDGIDINMGCPKKFSVSGGMGAALLQDLPRACDILKTLRRNIDLPLSCKIRLLKDNKSTVDFVLGLVQAGANAITIHGREPGDEAHKPGQLDRLVDVVKILKSTASLQSIPIIINGDLYTRNDMVNMRRESNADGVMLARPALYNTSLFLKPPSELSDPSGKETRYGYDSPLLLSKTKVIQDYLAQAKIYQGHPKNIKYVICEMMNNRRTPTPLVPSMPQKYPGGQTIDKVCKCKTMDALCKVWDVSMSSISSKHENGIKADTHRYDDRYFLDPEALRKERDTIENSRGSILKKSKSDAETGIGVKRQKIE
jgi:tRNA-dihydrouridine synthase 2